MLEATNGVVNGDSSVQYAKATEEVRCSEIGKNARFNRLPKRSPVDITFQNIVYSASLGFRKGRKISRIITGLLRSFYWLDILILLH